MSYNLDLTEDQQTIKDWVHEFSANVVRPAAEEWDEREEFPMPIVQEAANIGLYGWEFMASNMADPTGLTLPIAIEELFWGDAGIGLSIFGSGLAAAPVAHERSASAAARPVAAPRGRLASALMSTWPLTSSADTWFNSARARRRIQRGSATGPANKLRSSLRPRSACCDCNRDRDRDRVS